LNYPPSPKSTPAKKRKVCTCAYILIIMSLTVKRL
jgi:hypothetical protein